jgi:hypothetical protein
MDIVYCRIVLLLRLPKGGNFILKMLIPFFQRREFVNFLIAFLQPTFEVDVLLCQGFVACSEKLNLGFKLAYDFLRVKLILRRGRRGLEEGV